MERVVNLGLIRANSRKVRLDRLKQIAGPWGSVSAMGPTLAGWQCKLCQYTVPADAASPCLARAKHLKAHGEKGRQLKSAEAAEVRAKSMRRLTRRV